MRTRVMKGFIAATLLFVSVAGARSQGMPNMAPPAEVKAAEFLVGKFKGSANFYFGGQKSASACTAKAEKTLDGRWIQTKISYQMKMQGMPDMTVEGMHMLTYDPAVKQYVAWWFDGTASTVMRMAGNFEGDKLVLISDPVPMEPGGPPAVARSTWWKKGDGVGFTLEMKQGDSWAPMIDGEFHKG